MTRLKTVTHLVLVLMLVASTQGLLFVQGAYVLRQDYIAEWLCANPDDEDCNGRCFVRQQMEHLGHGHGAEAMDHEHPVSDQSKAVLGLALSVRALMPVSVDLDPPPVQDVRPRMVPVLAPALGSTDDVFRPPRRG